MHNVTTYTNTIAICIVSLNARLVRKMLQTLKMQKFSEIMLILGKETTHLRNTLAQETDSIIMLHSCSVIFQNGLRILSVIIEWLLIT